MAYTSVMAVNLLGDLDVFTNTNEGSEPRPGLVESRQEINTYRSNGIHLGAIDGQKYFKFDGCQQQLGPGKAAHIESTTPQHMVVCEGERFFTPTQRSLDGRVTRAWSKKGHNNNNNSITKEYRNGVQSKTKINVTRPASSSSQSQISLDIGSSKDEGNGGIKEERNSLINESGSTFNSEGHGIRPVTANCRTSNTRRYLENRVRLMYSQRRVTSSTSAQSNVSPRNSSRNHSGRGYLSTVHQENDERDNHQNMELGPLQKFRLVARMAIYLIRFMKAIILNSNDLTLRSAAELQWLTVYGRETEATMAFNKNLYSRDRVMTHIPDWALSILKLDPESRTELHCRRLHALLRGLKSFDKFTDEIQMSLCRAFRLEIVSEGRIVLKHGHIGVYFYFIYSGSVFVNAQDKAKDGNVFMRTIAILNRGQSFGELALLQDIKRTATVSVREKCELLVVDKDVFARVCPKIFEKELEEKRNFLSGMALFPSKWWNPEAMRALSMEAQIQEFKINKVIVPDSSLEDWIYTCMEGKCQVIHCLSMMSQNASSGDNSRQSSDIVLSEEIIDLLSSASANVTKTNEQDVDADIKEKLLSSLGLDYVASGKRRYGYMKDNLEKERLRAIQGLDDASTLTALMKKREETREDLVYLNVGVIETGQVFDLHSLVRLDRETPTQVSCLMLVSGGAKILKVRKAAFYEHATDQALEHTRTLASKQRFLSDESLIESYRQKKEWERYKSQVVNSVVHTRRFRWDYLDQQNNKITTPRPKSQRLKSSKHGVRPSTTMSLQSHDGDDNADRNSTCGTNSILPVVQKENQTPQPSTPVREETSNHVNFGQRERDLRDELEASNSAQPSFQTDIAIIRRKPMRSIPQGKVNRNISARPHTVHPRFSTR